jgi:ABC-type transport system involved in cytochrome c biogenesis permease component
MSFLPIVERELRVAARRRGTYWLRFGLVLGTLVIWFMLLATGKGSSGEMGKVLFVAVGIIALGFCLLAGVFLTADCLSEEKREGTLGLLFLTELKGYDVVLGKLIATSLHSFYGLLAVLPILALPLLMGGVTAGEFWRVTVALIATLMWSLSVGMVVSGFCRDARQAMGLTLVVLVVLAGLMPVLWWLKVWLMRGRPWDWLMWVSPPYLYSRSFDAYFGWRTGKAEFWRGLAMIGLVSAGSLVGASVLLPRFWQEKASGAGKKRGGNWWQRLRFGSPEGRFHRRLLMNENPFYWLAGRDRGPSWTAVAVLGLLFPVWVCFVAGCYARNMRTAVMCFYVVMFMAYGSHLMVKWLMAMEVSRRLSEDRRSGALELLLVTPLRRAQILAGQRQALLAMFLGPMALALASNAALFLIVVSPNLLRMPAKVAVMFCEIIAGGAGMMVVDFYALSWVGMWMAMKTRKHNRAILATLLRLTLAPWMTVLFFVFLLMGGRGPSEEEMMLLIAFWFGLGAAVELVFVMRAKMGLKEELRV